MTMKNQIIKITKEETDDSATEFFMKISGLNNKEDKNARLLSQGICLRDKIQDQINIRAVVSSFPGTIMKRNVITLDEVIFESNAFQSFDPNGIRGIYAFILTAGDFDNNDQISVLDQLYTDIWGTSYVEAGLSVLKQYIEQDLIEGAKQLNKGFTILNHFGPGFYGMDINQLKRFFVLLDSDSIGVKLESSGLMIPIKSCAGFFVAVNDGTKLPKSDCKNCRAEFKNCSFCQSAFN